MAFILSNQTEVATNYSSSKPLQNFINIFKRDLYKTIAEYSNSPANRIFIMIDASLDLAAEQFTLLITNEQILLTAIDEFGAIYGLVHISEHYLGVTPFWFWCDQTFIKRDSIIIPEQEFTSTPALVRFRGWFVNDEVLLSEWNLSGSNENVWPLVFETLLRCRGNMVIPGTDHNSKKNKQIAVDMGLWLSHHHAEPLGAEMFSRVYPDKTPSYVEHQDLFEQLWEEAILNQKDANVVWNIGFRGQGDRAFWSDDPRFRTAQERGALISQVMHTQCDLIRKHIAKPVFCTNLYGEILALYKAGCLDIPDDVIKIWGDSGYGKMVSRRQGNSNPRHEALAEINDPGLNGIYYHASFYDLQASSHITMIPNSPQLIDSELNDCLERKMDQYWIINCGNVKPHTYILDLIRAKWDQGDIELNSHLNAFLTPLFSAEYVPVITDLYKQYFANTILYGQHSDEKAGEQFYHHPARQLINAAMKGETDECVMQLHWATGNLGYRKQVERFKKQCDLAISGWMTLLQACQQLYRKLPGSEKQQFYDMFIMQVEIHLSGCQGFVAICESLLALLDKDYLEAFMAGNRAIEYYEQGVTAFENAEHGHWLGFYANDCLTNIRLTVHCCQTLCSYVRMLGDGPSFHHWERKFLYDAGDQKIVLLTNTTNHLSDQDLYTKLVKALEES